MKLKIICLNVWIGGILMDQILQFLKKENADVVLLQEVYSSKDTNLEPKHRTLEFLKEQLEYKYSHFAPAFIEDRDDIHLVQGNAILSKYELINAETLYYDVPFSKRIDEYEYYEVTPRSLECVDLVYANDSSEKNILHLMNTQGIWGEHGGDTERRIKMSEVICNKVDEKIADKNPLILAGDFNVEPNTKSIAMIEKKLTSIFKNELTTTFNLKHKDLVKSPGYAKSVVDMFFVSENINVMSHICSNEDVSDHLSLIVEVEV